MEVAGIIDVRIVEALYIGSWSIHQKNMKEKRKRKCEIIASSNPEKIGYKDGVPIECWAVKNKRIKISAK